MRIPRCVVRTSLAIPCFLLILCSPSQDAMKDTDVSFTTTKSTKVVKLTPFQQAVKNGCAPAEKFLRIRYEPQGKQPWCWAASGAMGLDSFGKVVRPCDLVNDYCEAKGLACKPLDCCATPDAKDCAIGGWPLLELHGVNYTCQEGALTPAQALQELGCNERPFAFAWKNVDRTGHMVLATGYYTEYGEDFLVIHDPQVGQSQPITWREYLKGHAGAWAAMHDLKEQS